MNETSDVIDINQQAAAIADYMVMVGCWHTSNGNWIFYRQELEHEFPDIDFSTRYSTVIDPIFVHLIAHKEVLDVEIKVESDPNTVEFIGFDVIFGLAYCPHAEVEDDETDEANDDNVNHPSHYTRGGIECIEAIRASMPSFAFQGYCKGNIMKYIWRSDMKNGLEDLKKAQVYLGWLIESVEKNNGKTD